MKVPFELGSLFKLSNAYHILDKENKSNYHFLTMMDRHIRKVKGLRSINNTERQNLFPSLKLSNDEYIKAELHGLHAIRIMMGCQYEFVKNMPYGNHQVLQNVKP